MPLDDSNWRRDGSGATWPQNWAYMGLLCIQPSPVMDKWQQYDAKIEAMFREVERVMQRRDLVCARPFSVHVDWRYGGPIADICDFRAMPILPQRALTRALASDEIHFTVVARVHPA